MLKKLSRETLAEQAARNLLAYIEDQDMKPGKVLPPENQLAANLGVSRPIIREALKSLAGQGIVEVVSGKGAIVKQLDSQVLQVFFRRATQIAPETIIDLMELRKGIEVQAAALAAQRRTPDELAQLMESVARMRRHLHEPKVYVEADIAFHLLIASTSHNDMIYHLVGAIRVAIKDTLRESMLRPQSAEQLEHVQVGHEAILTAIEHGDTEQAQHTMAAHFDDAVMSLVSGSIDKTTPQTTDGARA
jgi:GntR family transcriptional regulator, transcriptional repressor for pyruvate dehydrogenase complex